MKHLDKVIHFLAGFFITTVTFVIFKSLFIALVVSFITGVLKEVYDLKIKKTHFDWYDVFATFIGGIAAISSLQFI